MQKMSGAVAVVVFLLIPTVAIGQRLEGRVVDTLGRGVAGAEVRLLTGGQEVAIADGEGAFGLSIAAGMDSVCIEVTALGYTLRRQWVLTRGERTRVRIVLEESAIEIADVGVRGLASPYATMQRIDVGDLLKLQGAGSGVESLVKLLPGVHSSNELSSQYSVRGGSYDENLVYIDGIEVFRPQLARSGSQEGMSVINPDMVSAVEFSSGAFPASYGDKLSSVLNVRYRRPQRFAMRVDLSLMESRACVEGASADERFSGILGLRYKTTRLLLNTTETKGDYRPTYLDVQGKGNWSVSRDVEISALYGYSRNVYNFKPYKKVTRFGALTFDFLQMNVFYEGQEQDMYTTMFGALRADWRATSALTVRGQAVGYWMREEERFDILGEYWLSELRGVEDIRPVVDSASNVGVGGFFEHARNGLESFVVSSKGSVDYRFGIGNIEGGIEVMPRYFQHATNEWNLMDSAGYAMPYGGQGVPLHGVANGSGELWSVLYSAYAQTTLRFVFSAGNLTVVAGVRGSGEDNFRHIRVSPRLTISFEPQRASTLRLYAGGGVYSQYPFYREMRDRRGAVHSDVKPQRNVHVLGGVQWSVLMAGRPVKIQAEGYGKWGRDLIPYTVDNVRLSYEAQNAAAGHTYGLDVKINGELAPGVESWLSLSVMRSRMRITGELKEVSRQPLTGAYFFGPQDQLFGGSLFLQDYLPGVPGFRVSLHASYALGVPFSAPQGRYGQQARMPSYKRVDIGFSYAFKDANYSLGKLRGVHWLRSMVASVEVLNLLNFYNTVSYMWLQVPNAQGGRSLMAVPNYLTSRCVNIRFALSI